MRHILFIYADLCVDLLAHVESLPPLGADASVEQVALLLVVSVAMFGAAAGVRDAIHIGMDSLVTMLSEKAQYWCEAAVDVISVVFGVILLAGGAEMAISTHASTIPTLGLSEAVRYAPIMIGGILIALFSTEHLIAQFTGKEVVPSWH